ncbi:site-2 protease family protein [Leptolyngbya sp. PCC 6406]|uniref:site-2 protease family protein n=1 Tax=Leptolyngbya sp. PCC 6406 TaxID=1173264 RepID=UPI0002ABF969|nr:site-2 protease family protein [Leptolyngbya sp. PCC 6406]
MITLLLLLAAVGLLGWGFYRAWPYGKLGLFAWLQSVVLMAPWLLFFALFALGVYLNLAVVLGLVLGSAGIYVYLGRQLRKLGQAELLAQRAAALTQTDGVTDADARGPDEVSGESASHGSDDAAESTAGATIASNAVEAIPEIPAADRTALEGIFGVDTFFRTETVPYQQGAIFRGNLRGTPEDTLIKLNALKAERVGDRYRLFLIQDPSSKPVVVALPSETDPSPLTTPQKVLAVVLAVMTLLTCLEASGLLMGIDLAATPNQWIQVWPVAAGIIFILVAHEVGHWWMARWRQVKLSWPFFLPTWQIGSFGAVTRFESNLPDRSTLFDVAIAGPAAGGLVSLVMLFMGLVLSHPGSQFQVPAQFFQGSILVGALAKSVLGSALSQPLVDVHPLTLVGWLGLVITALNVMPAGQLDGGRIVQAIYGRKVAGRATVITLIVLAIASLANPLALYWSVLILFLQRTLERPAENELTEPNDARAALGLLALFLMLATLAPLTPSLAGRLGIGG